MWDWVLLHREALLAAYLPATTADETSIRRRLRL